MAVTITSNATAFGRNAQSMIYTLSESTLPLASDYKFVVRVLSGATEITKLYLTPNAADKAHFDLRGVVMHLTEADVTTPAGGNLQDLNTWFAKSNQIRQYTISVGTYVAGVETLGLASVTQYVVNGYTYGADNFDLWPSITEYASSTGSSKTWLTERAPENNVITMPCINDQRGTIAVYNHAAFGSDADRVRYTIYNGSTQLATSEWALATYGGQTASNTATEGKLLHVAAYPYNVTAALTGQGITTNRPNSLTTWTHYELQLRSSTTAKSNTLRFEQTSYVCKNTPVTIAWANKLGGWERLLFDGRLRSNHTADTKTYWSDTGTWNAATYTQSYILPQRKNYGGTAETSYDLRGAWSDWESYSIVPSLLRSTQVFAYIQTAWHPVTLETKTLPYAIDRASRREEITLTIKLANPTTC